MTVLVLVACATLTPSLHSHSFCGRVGDIPETAFTLASTGHGNESLLFQGTSGGKGGEVRRGRGKVNDE